MSLQATHFNAQQASNTSRQPLTHGMVSIPLEQAVYPRSTEREGGEGSMAEYTNSPELQNPVPAINVGPGANTTRASGPDTGPLSGQFNNGPPQRNYTAPGLGHAGRGAHAGGGRRGHGAFSRAPSTQHGSANSPAYNSGWHGSRGGRGYGRGEHHSQGMGGQPTPFAAGEGPARDQATAQQGGAGGRGAWMPSQNAAQNDAHSRGECRNTTIYPKFSYRPCGCLQCNERNRSVIVFVREPPEGDVMNLQTMIKFGTARLFGDVEAVFPTQVHYGAAFIVR